MRRFRLAIVGPGRAGKDTVAERLRDVHGFRYFGTTSIVITARIAAAAGLDAEYCHALRHKYREAWRAMGDLIRHKDDAALARAVLAAGDLCVGVRARVEMEAVIAEGLVDEVWWVDRPNLPTDPTLEFGPSVADRIVFNIGGLETLHSIVDQFARNFFARHAGARHA